MSLAGALRVLTLLAVLLAPLTMMASHAAAAPMPASHAMDSAGAMAGHCPPSGTEEDKQKPSAAIDCTIMCSAMPAYDIPIPARPGLAALELARPLATSGLGLNPVADPPPPRRS